MRKGATTITETFYPPKPTSTHWLRIFRVVSLVLLLLLTLPIGNGLLGAFTLEYRVTESAVQVRYGVRTEQIPLSEITRVWIVERPSKGVRLFGIGTPGLRTGRWRFAETGELSLYATELDQLAVIEYGSGGGLHRVGLTPAEPQALVDAVATGTPAILHPAGSPASAALGITVGFIIMLLAIAVVAITVSYAIRFARELHYELGPRELTIWTGWRPVRIPYREMTQVEIASPKGNPFKSAGTEVGGLRWGTFYWKAAGPKLSLYTTRAKPLVLIRTKSRTVGITPEEDERFVEALRQRMG